MPKPPPKFKIKGKAKKQDRRKRPRHQGQFPEGAEFEISVDVETGVDSLSVETDVSINGKLLYESDSRFAYLEPNELRKITQMLEQVGLVDSTVTVNSLPEFRRMQRLYFKTLITVAAMVAQSDPEDIMNAE